LHVVGRWLVAGGGLGLADLTAVDRLGRTPLGLACQHQPQVAAWLVLQGAAASAAGRTSAAAAVAAPVNAPAAAAAANGANAANGVDRHGHCDAEVLLRHAQSASVRAAVCRCLAAWLRQHAVFTRLVLPAVDQRRLAAPPARHARASRPAAVPNAKASRLFSPRAVGAASISTLSMLGGHEDTLLPLIADFAGVVRGRQLRNAREAAALLMPAKSLVLGHLLEGESNSPHDSTHSPQLAAGANSKGDMGDWCLFDFGEDALD
jgi:hypothetical protein